MKRLSQSGCYRGRSGGFRRGFTLFELLIAALVASFLITLVYMIYIKAARTFGVQNMTMEMQSRARFGLEHLRRDLANAGFNTTPNSTIDSNLCQKPTAGLRALTARLTQNAVPLPGVNTNIAPMEFTLFGDYTGNGEVLYTQSILGSTVTLQPDFKARISQAQFEDMFMGGQRRYLRIVDKEQYEHIVEIAGHDYAAGTISLTSAPPIQTNSQACGIQGFGEGLEVNSVNFILYRLALDVRTGAPTNKVDLVREDVSTDGVTVVPGTRLVIAEYVVDLMIYDVVLDTDTTGTQPVLQYIATNESKQLVTAGGAGLLGTASTRTQDLRFLTLKMTVRTAEEDPEFFLRARQSGTSPIAGFDVDSQMEGAARTFTLTTRVMMSTLAYRNLKAGAG
jgi:prepilin-type N-terminal cleavage/methylation domain-containing protein